MTKKNAVYITHGVRTAIGKIGKSLKDVSDTALSVIVIKNLLEERAKLDAQEIDHVIFGEILPEPQHCRRESRRRFPLIR